MLKPDERAHLLELLRPPQGCQLDFAVGTTFSLDLLSAMMVPLSFALFDWEQPDGRPEADPLALLEALRRYQDRFTIFCQAGQIRLPPKYPPLVAFLEPCIHEVQAPDEKGIFHPKVWALRFLADDGEVRYRLLCLSRNLTFDRCWDTVVALDGELADRSTAIAANHPLGDFFAALPKMALKARPVPSERRTRIREMSDELRRVRWTWPEGFEDRECRFWVGGLDGREAAPFEHNIEKCLIVSPFLTDSVVKWFQETGGKVHLVSRPEELQNLPAPTLKECKTVRFIQPQPPDDEVGDGLMEVGPNEVLEGLHAKLFVIDHGWYASIYSGSFNATNHALNHNVEFMIELVGKKSRFGVDQFLQQEKGAMRFADLLQDFNPSGAAAEIDETGRKLDELLQATKRELAAGGPRLFVSPAGDVGLFDVTLKWDRYPAFSEAVEVEAWPITQQAERGQVVAESIVFPRLSHEGLTPLIAFRITAKHGKVRRESVFVMNLPLGGAPADRQERILASLISGRDQLLRYILFILSAGDEAAATSGDLRRWITEPAPGGERPPPTPLLLESMLRALHRDPVQLQRVGSLLEALRTSPESSALLSAEFQSIWEPIWEAAERAMKK